MPLWHPDITLATPKSEGGQSGLFEGLHGSKYKGNSLCDLIIVLVRMAFSNEVKCTHRLIRKHLHDNIINVGTSQRGIMQAILSPRMLVRRKQVLFVLHSGSIIHLVFLFGVGTLLQHIAPLEVCVWMYDDI